MWKQSLKWILLNFNLYKEIFKSYFYIILLLLCSFLILSGCIKPALVPSENSKVHKVNPKLILDISKQNYIEGLKSYEEGDYLNAKNQIDIALNNIVLLNLPDDLSGVQLLEFSDPDNHDFYAVYNDLVSKLKDGIEEEEDEQSEIKTESVKQQTVVENKNIKPKLVQKVVQNKSEKKEKYRSQWNEMKINIEEIVKDDGKVKDQEYIENKLKTILLTFGESSPNEEAFKGLLKEINGFIEYFKTKGRKFFEKTLYRSYKYIPVITDIFKVKDMPEDLVYMAFIESGFNPIAVSSAKAKGIWQFMKATGKSYGLKISRGIDQRMDPLASTIAAREYLLDLLAIFGSRSFMLALASYNAGEGRIQYALKKLDNPFENRSFWHLRDLLPKETRDYVPAILAAIIMGHAPLRFGFKPFNNEFEPVIIPYKTSLKVLASLCGISEKKLRSLNTDLRKYHTTTEIPNFILAVPKGRKNVVESYMLKVKKSKKKSLNAVKVKKSTKKNIKTRTISYIVKKNNTLNDISKWFNISANKIKLYNRIPQNNKLKRGSKIIIKGLPLSFRKIKHTVERGDSLIRIANKYKIYSISDLKQWNGIVGNTIYKGQKLIILIGSKTTKRKTNLVKSVKKNIKKLYKIIYTVQKNNNLSTIAAYFNVNFRDIMKLNKLKRACHIKIGQKLNIKVKNAYSIIKYKVKKGETASHIIKKYKISLNDLAFTNGLGKKMTLKSGQSLLIYKKK